MNFFLTVSETANEESVEEDSLPKKFYFKYMLILELIEFYNNILLSGKQLESQKNAKIKLMQKENHRKLKKKAGDQ